MTSLPLSAVIITLNEEKNIEKCLSSIQFCNEIIVVDSGSTDNTTHIAQMLNATVIHQDWLGYGPQKQFAVEQAKNDWVLCIDADEVVSDTLQDSIKNIDFSKPSLANGFLAPRRNHFMGKALKHGEGYPDLSLRLFNRKQGHWSGDIVHEGVQVEGKTPILKGDLLHYSQDTIASYIQKQNRYTSLQAQQLYDKGKRCSHFKCISSPLVRFIKFYIFRLGFLDGLAGFVHINIGCFNAFCKYAKLLELQRNVQHNHKNTTKP